MGFMGLFIAGVIMLILLLMLVTGIIFLVVGAVLKRKDKVTAAKVFKIIGAVNVTVVVGVVGFAITPKSQKIETPDGYVKIKPAWYNEYKECLNVHDLDGLRKVVNKHPELIYYHDVNLVMLLDRGLYNCDVEMMSIAVENGAKFDEPLRYDHMTFYSSLDSFFAELGYPDNREDWVKGSANERMIAAVSFAIDHGAALNWETYHSYQHDNFYDIADEWLRSDGNISDTDMKLLAVIAGWK